MPDPSALPPSELRARFVRSARKSAEAVARVDRVRRQQAERTTAVRDLARVYGIDTDDEATRRGVILALVAVAGANDRDAALGALTELVGSWADAYPEAPVR